MTPMQPQRPQGDIARVLGAETPLNLPDAADMSPEAQAEYAQLVQQYGPEMASIMIQQKMAGRQSVASGVQSLQQLGQPGDPRSQFAQMAQLSQA